MPDGAKFDSSQLRHHLQLPATEEVSILTIPGQPTSQPAEELAVGRGCMAAQTA